MRLIGTHVCGMARMLQIKIPHATKLLSNTIRNHCHETEAEYVLVMTSPQMQRPGDTKTLTPRKAYTIIFVTLSCPHRHIAHTTMVPQPQGLKNDQPFYETFAVLGEAQGKAGGTMITRGPMSRLLYPKKALD